MSAPALLTINTLLDKHLGTEVFTPGLARIKAWIDLYQLYPTTSKIITICGTNGKGETTHCLGYLLKQAGHSYTQWTSPHIFEITERFMANGAQIDADQLLLLVEKWIKRLGDNPQIPLSYYEFLFVVFLDWQLALSPEFILLEVGLGGRLDAVNALDANSVILTSISRDHQEFLGNSYRGILQEKLGVLRTGIPLFTCMASDYLKSQIKKVVSNLDLQWEDIYSKADKKDFSAINQSLAYAALTKLSSKTIDKNTLANFHYVNRFEMEIGPSNLFLIGSHNPDGVRKLVQFLERHHYNKYDVVILSFSKRKEKDLITMTKTASTLGEEVWICQFDHNKAVDIEQLKFLLNDELKGRLNFVADYKKAFQELSQRPARVLVTGSYYFIGHIYSKFLSMGARPKKA